MEAASIFGIQKFTTLACINGAVIQLGNWSLQLILVDDLLLSLTEYEGNPKITHVALKIPHNIYRYHLGSAHKIWSTKIQFIYQTTVKQLGIR